MTIRYRRRHDSRKFVAIFFFLLLSTGLALAQVFKADILPPEVVIPGTQLLKITSSIIQGQEYSLFVNLPRTYTDPSKSFPVLYVLDGQWDFPLVTSVFGQEYYDGFVPGVIVVGITWGGKNPNPDSLRVRDFTPTKVKQAHQSGGAAEFLSFLRGELIPFIDSKFRTVKSDRTLMGSSLGGLFTLYAMFQDSGYFNRYVLTSPSLRWDNGAILVDEKEYADKRSRHPARLFIGIGELEEVAEFQKFAERLHSVGQELEVQTKVLQGMGHSGGKAEGYTRGLQAVFARPSLALGVKLLEQYAGLYRLSPEESVRISLENDHLVCHVFGNVRINLEAETESDFYARGQLLNIHFRKDSSGSISGAQLERYGREEFVSKIR